MAIVPSWLTTAEPTDCLLTRSLDGPSLTNWFGYDILGCDYYTRTVYGTRVSMTVGPCRARCLSGIIAVVLGSLAGFFGGIIDSVIARVTDVAIGIPAILAGIVIISFLPGPGVAQIILVLSVLSWPIMLRIMRGSVLEQKEEGYVVAARASGAGRGAHPAPPHPAQRHRPRAHLRDALCRARSSLRRRSCPTWGSGSQLPAISWGLMLADAAQDMQRAPHLLIPGAFLVAAVLAFLLLGEALRNALDPTRR